MTVIASGPVRRKNQHLTFGERLRRIRKERRLTQEELGKKAKIDGGYISRLENDEVDSPGLDTMQRLATALDVEVFEFTGGLGGDVEKAIMGSDLDDESKRMLVRLYRTLRPDIHR